MWCVFHAWPDGHSENPVDTNKNPLISNVSSSEGFDTEDDALARQRTLVAQYPDHKIWTEEVPY